MSDSQAAATALTNARTTLLFDYYFFGRLAMYLKFVERPEIPTLATEGKHIFYNPKFVLTLSASLLRSAIVHEVLHCAFAHFARRGVRKLNQWNRAGDYAINLILQENKFQIGESWLLNRAYADMSAEHIYDLLEQEQKQGQGQGQGQKQSGAGDAPGPGEPGGALDEIMDANPDEGTLDEQDMEWKIAVTAAAAEAKKQGKLPAGMQRFVDEITSPRVPWREVLHRFINQIARDDYAWSRPNRRMLSQGIYLPGMYSERMGPIAVVIDTSGSIDQPTLNAFGSEITAIVNSCRPEKTIVVYCDAKINRIDEFSPNDPLEFKMCGGGGTDFRPPFAHFAQAEEQPVALVYLTDMEGTFPSDPPDFPVLWCATTKAEGPFGETLYIDV